MPNIHKSIEELVGNTPLLELSNYEIKKKLYGRIAVKLELANPNQSVKDRIAFAMINDAEKRGLLHKGDIIVDTTSGNTGIGLAAAAAVKGYRFRVYIQDEVSIERFQVIHAFGGETIKLSEVPTVAQILQETGGDFIAATQELERLLKASGEPIVFVNQIVNPANPQIHKETTGPEIWRDTDGNVDYFVAAVGTGGTISGAGAYLKSRNPGIRIAAVQPGPNSLPSEENPHPDEIFGVHPFVGIDEKFLPKTFNRNIYDEAFAIETVEAYQAAREAAKYDGILLGTSSGAILAAATKIAQRPETSGKLIVAVAPDTGLRYLTTPLYDV